MLLCVLYTLVAARPSSFESDLIVTDADGFFKSGHARRDDVSSLFITGKIQTLTRAGERCPGI